MEDTSQENIESSIKTESTSQISTHSNKSSKSEVLIILGIIFGFILSGFGGYYLGTQKINLQKEIQLDSVTSEESGFATPTPISKEEDTLCGIEKVRLLDPIVYEGKAYYIYQRNSMNIPIEGQNNYLDSGAFVVQNEQEETCEKLLEISDENPPKNNVYEILVEKDNLYILVVDQIGAGSGEGSAKILKSADQGKTWSLDYCFYYIPEEWLSIKDFLSKNPEELSPDESYECRNFILEQKEAGISSWADYRPK